MGGLYSGRTRRHTCIDDCIELDITRFRKMKLIGDSKKSMSLECKKWKESDFVKRTEQSYKMTASFLAGDHPTLTLDYTVVWTNEYGSKKQHDHLHTLNMVSTPCHYGGVRYWFTAPCCHRRVRVLYINPKRGDIEHMTPQCRDCLELHYASQMASYIERHKTYERYLLANYGLLWASHRYNYELKERYLEMTPQLYALRAKAVIDRNTHILKHIIKFDLFMLKHYMHGFKTLKSEEDRRIWLEYMREHEERMQTQKTIKLCLSIIENEREELRYHLHGWQDMSNEHHEKTAHTLEQEPGVEHFEQNIIDLQSVLKHLPTLKKVA